MEQPVVLDKVKNPENLNINGLFVAVFGGSSKHEKFEKAVEDLGVLFHKHKYNIVYGGGSGGPMGSAPVKLNALGGQVIGVLPRVWENGCGETPGHLILVNTLSERKQLFFEYACAFVAVPGGFGTLDEVLEYITWRQMGLHKKPIILLNINGFFDKFIEWADHAHNEGLIRQSCKEILIVAKTAEEITDYLNKQTDLAPKF